MKNKIKVLHFIAQVNKNDFVDSIVSNVDKSRFEMQVCVLHFHPQFQFPDYEKQGVVYYVLNSVERYQYLGVVWKLISIIKKNKIDIVHAHLFDESFLMAIVKLCMPRVKFVIGRHYSDEIYLTSQGVKRKKSLWIESFSNRMADRIVSPSSFITNLLKSQKVNPAKIVNITYGFDFTSDKYLRNSSEEIALTRKSLGISDDVFIFSNIGRHYFLKGQDHLIDAFHDFLIKHPKSILLMIGDGPWNEHLKQKVKENGIESSVFFTGWRKDIKNLICLSDVIVQPTMTEAFPQIMIEAMALKTPLIITPVSGAGDQVKDKETGVLIKTNDSKSIEHALDWMIDHQVERLTIANNAYVYIHDTLTITKVIKKFEQLYEELV